TAMAAMTAASASVIISSPNVKPLGFRLGVLRILMVRDYRSVPSKARRIPISGQAAEMSGEGFVILSKGRASKPPLVPRGISVYKDTSLCNDTGPLPMSDLTPRQRQILKLIQQCIAENGMPPTRAEIAQE